MRVSSTLRKTANGVTRVRRMVKDAISDDEVKVLVRKRRIHEIGLHDRAVRKIARILECGEGRIRNVQRVNCAAAMLSDEPGVEAGARPDL